MPKENEINSILNDLKSLAKLLDKYKFKENGRIELTRLEEVISDVESKLGAKNRKKMVFATKNEGIAFHTLTTGMNANPATNKQKLDLYLEISYEYNSDGVAVEEMIKQYNLNLHINGVQKNNPSNHDFGWHLDGFEEMKHDVNRKKKSKKNNKLQFIHPYYHFHAGGKAIAGKGPGSLMLLSSPRLPHPPMDIVLAVNFVICHFYSTHEVRFSEEMGIFTDDDYKQLVNRSAMRIYKPYYEEIKDHIINSKYVPLLP